MDKRGLTATPSLQPHASPDAAEPALRPWGNVPDNILVRVSAFLPCRADGVHMTCVNRQWSFAVRGLGRPPSAVLPPLPSLPPRLPWLIFPSTEAPTFYSPIACCYHRLGGLLPDVCRARCCGSGHGGWLVLALDVPHVHALYNLNSGRRIPLPLGSVSPTSTELPFDMRTAALSSAPYMVIVAIVLVADGPTAALWIEGFESWFSPRRLLTLGLQDLVCHAGRFFFVTSDENVMEILLECSKPNAILLFDCVDYEVQQREDYDDDVDSVRGNGTMKHYLVRSRGSLLLVVRYVYDHHEGTRPGVDLIRVFQLCQPPTTNCRRPRLVWEDLNGQLDGRMLFLGSGCYTSFEVADYDGFEDSMIYFLDEGLVSEPSADGRRWYSFTDMVRYSTEEGTKVTWPPGHPSMSDNAPPTWWLH